MQRFLYRPIVLCLECKEILLWSQDLPWRTICASSTILSSADTRSCKAGSAFRATKKLCKLCKYQWGKEEKNGNEFEEHKNICCLEKWLSSIASKGKVMFLLLDCAGVPNIWNLKIVFIKSYQSSLNLISVLFILINLTKFKSCEFEIKWDELEKELKWRDGGVEMARVI